MEEVDYFAVKQQHQMTIVTDQREVEEENPPPMFESEMISKTRRIALFVEPSPFA